jgi:hypothetical protein
MESTPSPSRAASPGEWWLIFDPRCSLRARAALWIGVGAAAFVALTVWFATQVHRRAVDVQTRATFETLAFEVGDKIDRVIYERQHQLQFLASLPAFRTAPAGESGAAQRREILEALQAEWPDFAWVGFADTRGHITAGTGRRFEGETVPTRPWFRGAQEKPFAGHLHEIPELPRAPGSDGEARYLDLAVPVQGRDGRPIGVLGAHVRWTWAADVARSVITQTAHREQIGVTVYAGDADVLLDTGASGWTLPPNAPPRPGPRVFRGSLIETFSLGTRYVTGFSQSRGFRDYRGLGWLVAVRQPVDRAFASVGELQRRLARWGIALVVAFTFAGWFLLHPLVRRLQIMRAAADRIRGGDVLSVMPRHPGETELSATCESVGRLVEHLRAESPPPPTPAVPSTPPPPGGFVRPTGADPRRVVW